MTATTSMRSAVSGVLALGLVMTSAPRAAAYLSSEIYQCGQRCNTSCGDPAICRTASNGKCTLANDITCGATTPIGPGIEVTSGLTVDLAGYDVTCTEVAPSTCNYNAIKIVAANGKVTNSSTTAESVISGLFYAGVDCQSNTNSEVSKLVVNDGVYGIRDCKTVKQNIVGPTLQGGFANWGISTGGVSNADSISNNFISGRILPIFHSGTTSISVSSNVIDTTDTSVTAITLGSGRSSTSGNANNNIFFGPGYDGSSLLISIGGTDNVTSAGNFCDPNHADCAGCISSGHCEAYAAPFVGN